jgi:hypothetical protein
MGISSPLVTVLMNYLGSIMDLTIVRKSELTVLFPAPVGPMTLEQKYIISWDMM